MAAPPTAASRALKGRQAPSTDSAASVTSGPIPSPLRTAIVATMGQASRTSVTVRRLVRRDGLSLREEELQLVDAFHQAVARERLDRKRRPAAVGQGDGGALEIDGDLGAGIGQQLRVRLGFDHDREQAVLERVAAEDVGERGADDRADAVVVEGPDRVLAR